MWRQRKGCSRSRRREANGEYEMKITKWKGDLYEEGRLAQEITTPQLLRVSRILVFFLLRLKKYDLVQSADSWRMGSDRCICMCH